MAVSFPLPRRQLFGIGFWVAFGAVTLCLIGLAAWRFSGAAVAVSTPFVLGLTLALLLDPLADRLERRGLSRGVAAGIVFGLFFLLLAGLTAVVVPALINESRNLATQAPQYVDNIRGVVNSFLARHHRLGTLKMPANFDALLNQLSGKASALVQKSAGSVSGFLVGSVTLVLQAVVTLIVTFFLLLDIDRLRARILFLVPEQRRGLVAQLGTDIGDVFASYLRGLVIVCALYGVTTVLLFYGLSVKYHAMASYALLLGALAGVLYAVPYLGALTIALVTFLVASAAGGLGFGGLAVLLTLVVNQVFDNVITPRVVGGGVGLHPVVALFALTVGGELFKLWGLLLSVPIAASIQVILFRFFPKLTAPTPPEFLRAQGVQPDRGDTAKIMTDSPSEPPPGPMS